MPHPRLPATHPQSRQVRNQPFLALFKLLVDALESGTDKSCCTACLSASLQYESCHYTKSHDFDNNFRRKIMFHIIPRPCFSGRTFYCNQRCQKDTDHLLPNCSVATAAAAVCSAAAPTAATSSGEPFKLSLSDRSPRQIVVIHCLMSSESAGQPASASCFASTQPSTTGRFLLLRPCNNSSCIWYLASFVCRHQGPPHRRL